MRYLLLLFVLCLGVLGVLLWRQPQSNAFADGHLAHPPLPAALVRVEEAGLEPASEAPMALLPAPTPGERVSAASIQILEPERGEEHLARLGVGDQADWGIGRLPEPTPRVATEAVIPRRKSARASKTS
jgi:hypothetical protein